MTLPPPAPAPAPYTAWLDAMLFVARHYRLSSAAEHVHAALAWERDAPLEPLLQQMARQLGLGLRNVPLDDAWLNAWRLPLVIEFDDGQIGVVRTLDSQGHAGVLFSSDLGLETEVPVTQLRERAKRVLLLRPQSTVPDARVDDYIRPYRKNWFWDIVTRDWRRCGDIIAASLFANLLALSGVIFSMQIYDRVVPSQSESTLWVLFIGVMLAIVFEFSLRVARTHLIDTVGKRADLRLSELVFGHALRIRSDARPKSTGSFIAQIRELEQVRELLTSTAMNALADLPFFVLFLVILWLIGGPLVFVVLAAVPLLVLPGLLIQRPLARLSREGLRESALRNAMLVEAVQGLDDIKLLRAEARFENQWNHVNATGAGISMRQRLLTSLLMTWTQEIQSIVYAVVLLVGSYLVINGEMTTGALVGTSILSSRMMSPLSQVSGFFSRWQQAKVARKGLDELMRQPVDQPEHARQVHKAALHGTYSFSGVQFHYDKNDRQAAVSVAGLKIEAGEKIAVLGRMGAGKSTLLQLLAGLHAPQRGQITLDGLTLGLIDPADVRRDMSLLGQQAHLFHGTIRDNVLMGMPLASDDQVLRALDMAGAAAFVQTRTKGLDATLLEGGHGLSGGQRQALLLARTLLRDCAIVLLDEPTAHFDDSTERHVIDAIHAWLPARTLVVATHRMAVLKWVDRIIVMDEGAIIMDGPKDQVLGELAA
ncbi:type I secretion system permease/ATPase [Paraburkholderia hayleyella]|uniref:type I secretion system permease/ATPase n=1 Tax=Paraburkholderia hayleyella TaxID=2152889 RepID=UPI001292AF6B|nr:type I secretion system permease/ATPase [Paraburkholderia hayleyella]